MLIAAVSILTAILVHMGSAVHRTRLIAGKPISRKETMVFFVINILFATGIGTMVYGILNGLFG